MFCMALLAALCVMSLNAQVTATRLKNGESPTISTQGVEPLRTGTRAVLMPSEQSAIIPRSEATRTNVPSVRPDTSPERGTSITPPSPLKGREMPQRGGSDARAYSLQAKSAASCEATVTVDSNYGDGFSWTLTDDATGTVLASGGPQSPLYDNAAKTVNVTLTGNATFYLWHHNYTDNWAMVIITVDGNEVVYLPLFYPHNVGSVTEAVQCSPPAPAGCETTIAITSSHGDGFSWTLTDDATGTVLASGGTQSPTGDNAIKTVNVTLTGNATFYMWQHSYSDNSATISITVDGEEVFYLYVPTVYGGYVLNEPVLCSPPVSTGCEAKVIISSVTYGDGFSWTLTDDATGEILLSGGQQSPDGSSVYTGTFTTTLTGNATFYIWRHAYTDNGVALTIEVDGMEVYSLVKSNMDSGWYEETPVLCSPAECEASVIISSVTYGDGFSWTLTDDATGNILLSGGLQSPTGSEVEFGTFTTTFTGSATFYIWRHAYDDNGVALTIEVNGMEVYSLVKSNMESGWYEETTLQCTGGGDPGDCQNYTIQPVGNEGLILPLDSYPSYTQQIYRASEINCPAGGLIKSLSFQMGYISGGSITRTNQILYLANTTKNTFDYDGDWIPLIAFTKVYDGTITYNKLAPEWITIEFTTPFEYTGGNLVLAAHNNSAYTSYFYFNGVLDVEEGITMYYTSSSLIDPATTYGYRDPNRSNARFNICNDGGGDDFDGCPKTFEYTGGVQEINLKPGVYEIECWGANGGASYGSGYEGKGGYSKGMLNLTSTTTLYISVGGHGTTGYAQPGGWNGGGSLGFYGGGEGSGGGATHVATKTGVLSSLQSSQSDVVIVAGGGGGAGCNYCGSSDVGGNGGGSNGAGGNNNLTTGTPAMAGKGGTQSAGGEGGYYSGTYAGSGAFGLGGTASVGNGNGSTPGSHTGGGGGGGWYGGGAGHWEGGGGGSGYIGGVTGGVTAQPTQSGFTTNPDNSGHGFVRISSPVFCEDGCNPPTNLTASYDEECVAQLTWDAPAGGGGGEGTITTNPFSGSAAGGGVAFDIIAGAQDVTITEIEFPFGAAGIRSVNAYYRPNSSCGNVTSSSGWTSIGIIDVNVINAVPALSAMPLPAPITIPAGDTYGFYFAVLNPGSNGIKYTNELTGDICSATVTASNSDLTIMEGTGLQGTTAPFTGGNTWPGRDFCGVIHYTTPGSGDVIPYNIYRDGEYLTTVEDTYYDDVIPEPTVGYTWTVTTVCDDDESTPVTITLDACKEFEGCAETFEYSGGVQELTLQPGVYQIECWGANGGSTGGKGGYSKGFYTVTSTETIYIYVGGQGTTGTLMSGGWNGGGNLANGPHFSTGGGGGGTDVRLSQNSAYSDRIIVAGGGGGEGTDEPTGIGGHGGGTTGLGGNSSTISGYYDGSYTSGGGGTQTAGGTFDTNPSFPGATGGSFGVGGTGYGNSGGGGGGGWYGGGGGLHMGGGGGSGYIGGVTGGITAQSTETNFIANPDLSGHGFVRITSPLFCEEPCASPTNFTATYNNDCNVELAWDAVNNGVSGSITTQPAGNGSGAVTLDVIAGPKDVTITGFETEFAAAGAATVYIYYRLGTACGYATTSAGWISVCEVNITVPGSNTNVYVPMSATLTIPAGETYGIYIATIGGSSAPGRVRYFNGGSTCGATTIASNGDLTLLGGHGVTSVTTLFTGSVNQERCFAGFIDYTIDSDDEPIYNLYRDDEPIAIGITETTYTDTDADPLEEHTWTVIQICMDDLESSAASATLQPLLLDIPVATAATNITTTSFDANWNPATGATEYLLSVYTKDAANQPVYLFEDLSVGNVTTYSITDLNPGTTYYYTVKGILLCLTSEASNEIEVTTIPVFNIVATAGPNGSIDPSGITIIEQGDNLTVCFEANEGFVIAKVLVDGDELIEYFELEDGCYTFENVTENHTITVMFKSASVPAAFTIIATTDAGGKITPAGNITVNPGVNQKFTFSALAGYEIADVLIDGFSDATAVADGFYTFFDVDDDHTIHVVIDPLESEECIVHVSFGQGGTISPNGTVNVPKGEYQTFSITPQQGYKIDQVWIDNDNTSTEALDAIANGYHIFYGDTDPDCEHWISATFTYISIEQFYITASVSTTGGTISPTGKILVTTGDEPEFVFTPQTGYELTDLLIDGVSLSSSDLAVVKASGIYTFAPVFEAHTIVGKFGKANFVITSSIGTAGGTINPVGDKTVAYGGSQAYTITAQAGYMIDDVLIDGATNPAAISSGKYTFSNVTKNYTIVANFKYKTYDITSSVSGTGGIISPNGITAVIHGDGITYSIIPDANYVIKSVLVDGKNNAGAVSSGTYTFNNVTAKHTIVATFVVAKDAEAEYNESAEITLFPNPTTGELRVESGELRVETIVVFDMLGRKVMTVTESQIANRKSQITFDISNVPAGVYFVRIQTENGVVTRKVVKE